MAGKWFCHKIRKSLTLNFSQVRSTSGNQSWKPLMELLVRKWYFNVYSKAWLKCSFDSSAGCSQNQVWVRTGKLAYGCQVFLIQYKRTSQR